MGIAFQDYYKTLGVERSATEKEIKTAYRKLARKWHPDLHSGDEKQKAEEQFKQINEAYEVLSDQEKRSKYDRMGANWRDGQDFKPPPDMGDFKFYTNMGGGGMGGAGGFSDFFEMFFGGGSSGSPFGGASRNTRAGRSAHGQDVEAELELTLEEAYRGGEKHLQLSTREACPSCGGSGIEGDSFCNRCGGTGTSAGVRTLTVKIPAGVHEGSRIRLKGQGGEGYGGGAKGDLYLKVRLLSHPRFKVQGDDLETEVLLRPEQAVLGDQVSVPTLDGPVKMKVPAGIKTGRRLRLRGKGMPRKDGRGDEFVRIVIDIPDTLTPEEESLYRQLAALKKGV